MFERCFVDLTEKAELRRVRFGERFGNVKLTHNGDVVGCKSVVKSEGAKEAVTLFKKDLREATLVCWVSDRLTEAEYFWNVMQFSCGWLRFRSGC